MSNYVQIELGGELRGLKFNQGAHVEIQEKLQGIKNPVFASYAVIYGGLIGNCFVKGIEPNFTFEEVCDWSDKIKIDDVNLIVSAYKASLPVVDDKKKVIKQSMQKSIKRKALK
jgi:hypothetical protein